MEFLENDAVRFLVILGIVLLLTVYILLMSFGRNFIALRKAKNAPIEQFSATVAKVTYETAYAPPRIFFLKDGEKKPRVFASRKAAVAKVPEVGTRVIVTCKGDILYSFEWDGIRIVQDEPKGGDFHYSDLI